MVCEKLYHIDWNGDVVPNKVDRGEWSLAVAQSDKPYRFVQNVKEYPDGKHYTQLEQHTVYHYGCKWGCLVDKTTQEPVWNSPDWALLEGDKNYHIEFESSKGWQFFVSNIDTEITAKISYGNRDISDSLLATVGVQSEWLRDTGLSAADNSWKPNFVGGKQNVIHLTRDDMGSGWGHEYRQVSFIWRVFIPNGEEYKKIEDRINIKL